MNKKIIKISANKTPTYFEVLDHSKEYKIILLLTGVFNFVVCYQMPLYHQFYEMFDQEPSQTSLDMLLLNKVLASTERHGIIFMWNVTVFNFN